MQTTNKSGPSWSTPTLGTPSVGQAWEPAGIQAQSSPGRLPSLSRGSRSGRSLEVGAGIMAIDAKPFVLSNRDQVIPAELHRVQDLKLRIGKSGLKRLEDLADYPNITELDLLDYGGPSFAPLASLHRLRRLYIMDFSHV